MPFSSNFTKVTRAQENGREVLKVEGTTKDREQDMKAMYVAVDSLPSVRVENAPGSVQWVATLNAEQLPAVDSWVTAVGVAERDGVEQPFLWGQTLQVQAQL
jgi:hypothetical protein